MQKPEKDSRFIKVTIRILPEPWQKLEWLATEQGITRPGIVRQLLTAAVKNVKPPNSRDIEGITAGEWKAWRSLAESRGVDVSDLVRDIMERVTTKAKNGSPIRP